MNGLKNSHRAALRLFGVAVSVHVSSFLGRQCGVHVQGVDGLHDGLGDREVLVDGLCVPLGEEAREGLKLVTMRCA